MEPKYLFTIFLLLTIIVITYATKKYATSTVEFYVGGRSFGWFLNGSAIAGDYLSAATFLGLAGLTFALGYDGIFYTFCFSVGLTLLALFVAGPLRKFGRFTIPDFLAERFHSPSARLFAVMVVLAISGFYAAPQVLGGAQILQLFFGLSYETGVISIVLVMMFYVGIGGMKGTTINQALEIWIRFGAFLALLAGAIYMGLNYGKILELIASWTGPVPGTGAYTKDGADIVANGAKWSYVGGGIFKDMWGTLSMVIGLAFGTMGLPHVLLRFYTNPSAKEARYSALFAIVIASLFFAIALYLGTVGRYLFLTGAKAGTIAPDMMKAFVTGGQNMVIPTVSDIIGGRWLLGFVVSGAFAAVFSNLSGLFIASSGALGHDLYTHFINKNASETQRVVAGKIAVVIVGVFYGILGLLVKTAAIGHLVGLAFNVAASTFAPIFLMGIWWRGMTKNAALWGMVVGLVSSLYMIFFVQTLPTWMQWRIPGLVTVPLAFLTIYIVSKIEGKVPADVNNFMEQIHYSDLKA
jgi:cation/acetate symporter